MYFGAITQHKRLNVLLKATRILTPEYPNLVCNIVGPPSAVKDELMRAVPKEFINNIVFHEPYYGEDLSRFLSGMDVFVMPGIGGLAVNEAMANGLVVVSTPGDGTIPDLVEDGMNGFLVDHFVSAEEMAETLRTLLSMAPDEICVMGAASADGILVRAPLNGMVTGFLNAIYH